MAKFSHKESLNEFQQLIFTIYGVSNDRQFGIHDLTSNIERFTMRALKGIRKGDNNKIKINLLISLSYFMAVLNRLHIESEEVVWKRFPMLCSYCGKKPCACKKLKPKTRPSISRKSSLKPTTLAGFQQMFREIYPPETRTLEHAGVHLAEETGEVSEAIHNYMNTHTTKAFENVREEVADYISCTFGVANSAKIDVAAELEKMYEHNCHVCHTAPCSCTFTFIAEYRS
ncbi:MAG: hypothetical protein HZA95_00305 [Candidatus Vogelbacteria bacterium]|nr:hypothetical protein [Candidatus Vogelbacteria bacterium]